MVIKIEPEVQVEIALNLFGRFMEDKRVPKYHKKYSTTFGRWLEGDYINSPIHEKAGL